MNLMRKLTKSAFLALGLAAAQHVSAFTLWGPVEGWQTSDLDYSNPAGSIRYYYFNVDPGFDGRENGAPKNFGEGSRLTTPILTYGFDATFLDYFGAQGVAAVDSAMHVLNALPSASEANLANFLTDGAEQINYTAQAMELLDIKSTVLWLMANHMGLLGETHVYDLAARSHYSTPACTYEYFVINRNYDPITYQPSLYVNGRLQWYTIWDGCPLVNVAEPAEHPPDSTAPRFSAVATGNNLEFGGFYLNFTRDDMGGLKFLYNSKYYDYQSLDSNTVVEPFANDTYEAVGTNAITGISNFVGLIGGVEKITFVKVGFDSQLNPGFTPLTYHYSVPWVTNSRLSTLSVARTVNTPDILFTAAFLTTENPLGDTTLARSGSFIQSPYVSPGGGIVPSTIAAPVLVVLNNVGPIYYDVNPGFLDFQDPFEYPVFNWGSFDGSTNPPVVFPEGTSLAELEAEVLEGGTPVSVSPWVPVNTINTNTTTTTTGTVTGGQISP